MPLLRRAYSHVLHCKRQILRKDFGHRLCRDGVEIGTTAGGSCRNCGSDFGCVRSSPPPKVAVAG